MELTTVKLRPNFNGLTATHMTLQSCHIRLRPLNPTTLINWHSCRQTTAEAITEMASIADKLLLLQQYYRQYLQSWCKYCSWVSYTVCKQQAYNILQENSRKFGYICIYLFIVWDNVGIQSNLSEKFLDDLLSKYNFRNQRYKGDTNRMHNKQWLPKKQEDLVLVIPQCHFYLTLQAGHPSRMDM